MGLAELFKQYRSAWVVMALVAMFGCSVSPIYYPEEVQTPQFSGQKQLSAAVSINGVERGFSGSAAYSLTDRYFLTGKYSISRLGNCETCTTNVRDYVEFSAGKYNLISPLNFTEALIGVGKGNAKSLEALPFAKSVRQTRSNYYRLFVQTNWSKKTTHLNSIFSLRTVFLDLDNYVELNDAGKNITPVGRNWSLFIEPAVTLKFWQGNFYVKGQLGFSAPLLLDNKFKHDWVWLVAGAGYRFAQ